MVLASTVLGSLESFINLETQETIGREYPILSTENLYNRVSRSFNAQETKLIDELRSSVESDMKRIFGSDLSSKLVLLPNIVEEFSRDIKRVVDSCLHGDFNYRIGNPELSQEFSRDKGYPQWFTETSNRLTSELDYVLTSAGIRTITKIKDRDLWVGFIVNDLARCIQSVNSHCSKMISDQSKTNSYSSVQLGRMYAWARELPNANSIPTENSNFSVQLRNRICRKLSHLVGLSKAGKLRTRTHPVLASLRHDLLRIRTRVTGRVYSDKHTMPIFNVTGNLHPMRFEDNTLSCIKRFLLPRLVSAFEKLSDDITESLLKLDTDIPGISFAKEIENPDIRRKSLHDQVSLAIFSFYTHLNESDDSGISGDAKHFMDESLTLPPSPSDTDAPGDSEELLLREDEMNPAVVQTTLDRFDHLNRNNYKRSTTNRSAKEPTEETGRNQNSSTRTTETTQEKSLSAHNNSKSGDVCNLSAVGSGDEKMQVPMELDNLHSGSRTYSTSDDDRVDRENAEDENEQSTHGNINKKPSIRSLRTRRSRTPSENSYSEGEVLSDSEEDQETTDDDLEHKQLQTQEKTKPSDREIQKEEMMRIVNKQLDDATPVSDIDLTELEIMDEWAPPTVPVPFENPTEDSVELSEINLPKDQLVEATAQQEVGVSGIPKDTELKLQQTLSEALHYCQDGMQSLILRNEANSDDDPLPKSFSIEEIKLSGDLEASIERTASVFKEHVTTVLANLLHAAPSMLKSISTDETIRKGQIATRRPLAHHKQSRLRGMLRAYQEDAKKRLNSNIAG